MGKNRMIARNMAPHEIDVTYNLFRQYCLEAAEVKPELDEQWDKTSVIETIRSRNIHPEYVWINLLEGTRPVGFISGAVTQCPWNHDIYYAHIELIFVLESHRNSSNFKMLTDEFEQWARGMEATVITAGDIGIAPERTKKIYESIGFESGCFLTKELAE
jgi:GNAT superfamily N-acetyltransferase